MLSRPSQLSTVSTNVRRLVSLIQKEHARQGKRHKTRITLRLPLATVWLHTLSKDKQERTHVFACVNEIIEHTGWQIAGSTTSTPSHWGTRAMMLTMAYRAARDEGLEEDACAA
jgi:hypothetical protein